MSVNDASVLDALEKYFKSKECEKKINGTISMYIKKGIFTTNSGAKVIDEKWMKNTAMMLRDTIIRIASGCNLPGGVMDDINSLECRPPVREGDSIRIDLVFKNDLSRESLYPDKYDGEDKLKNIIALFNTGYQTDNRVYGWWYSHEYDRSKDKAGEVLFRTGNVQNSVFIGSLTHREGLEFMQKAVQDFFNVIGSGVNVVVSLSPIYDIKP